jgi:hypothetical protein
MSDQPIVPNSMPTNIYGPITAGQMFDRAFTLLRENFKLFFGIVLILVGVEIIFGGIMGGSAFWMGRSVSDAAPLARFLFIAPAFFVGVVLFVILVQIIQGALFIATQAKLAKAPITVGEACKAAADRAGRLIGIALLVLVRTIGYLLLFYIASVVLALIVALMFGGLRHVGGAVPFNFGHGASFGLIAVAILVLLVWLVLYVLLMLWLWARYILSIPAALAEDMPITEAIRRSIHLSRGSKGRLYALALGIFVLYVVIDAVMIPLQLMVRHPFNTHIGISAGVAGLFVLLLGIFSTLISAFVMALMGVGTALCYYDLRVRKEGFGVVTPPVVPVATAEIWPVPPEAPIGDLPIS